MIIIALTGSLATGKTTVSTLLSSPPHSLPLIDADLLARQVVAPGTLGYQRIIAHFGPTTPDLLLPLEPADADSSAATAARPEPGASTEGGARERKGRAINRAALGRRVFGDGAERARERGALNAIVHPLVRVAMAKALLYYHLMGYGAVVVDTPLLYESGLDLFCSIVVMVAVSDAEVQMRRLRERDKALSAEEARDRVGSQMGVVEKVERTRARGEGRGKVVWNDGGKAELKKEVERVVEEIRREGGGGLRRWWLWGSPLGVVGVGGWEVWKGWRARKRWEVERRREKARL